MSAPRKETPGSQKEGSSKIQVEPLRENELGEVEGGFSDLSSTGDDEGVPINAIACPGPMPNRSQCGDQTT